MILQHLYIFVVIVYAYYNFIKLCIWLDCLYIESQIKFDHFNRLLFLACLSFFVLLDSTCIYIYIHLTIIISSLTIIDDCCTNKPQLRHLKRIRIREEPTATNAKSPENNTQSVNL